MDSQKNQLMNESLKPTGNILDDHEKAMRVIWRSFSALYADKFVSTNGLPNGSGYQSWSDRLKRFPLSVIIEVVKSIEVGGAYKQWPPNLKQMIDECQTAQRRLQLEATTNHYRLEARPSKKQVGRDAIAKMREGL